MGDATPPLPQPGQPTMNLLAPERSGLLLVDLLLGALVLLILCLAFLAFAGDSDSDLEAPTGCTYVDVNPSKGADYRLACVEGYGT